VRTDDDLAGRGIRVLRIGAPWPLDQQIVRRFARGLREVLVVEDKRTFLEDQVRVALYGGPDQPVVLGKTDATGLPLLPRVGELGADEITPVLRRFLTAAGVEAAGVEVTAGAVDPIPGRNRPSLPFAVRTPARTSVTARSRIRACSPCGRRWRAAPTSPTRCSTTAPSR
jgi:indolepyruvate ferredoxin oxidoreductase